MMAGSIEIKELKRLDALVKVPGSKSYTQRALAAASLANGDSVIENPLLSEDTLYLIEALKLLGAEINTGDGPLRIRGTGGRIKNPRQEIYLGNNGTALRLLTSVVSLGKGAFTLTGGPRLCERPVGPLLESLEQCGVKIRDKEKNRYPPVVIQAGGVEGGKILLGGLESSQYVSSLLLTAPYFKRDTVLELEGPPPSFPYIPMTVDVMKAFGGEVRVPSLTRYEVRSGRMYQGTRYTIEGDASSASYFFLAAALTGGKVRVEPMRIDTLQGDIRLLKIFEQMGCIIQEKGNGVEVRGGKLPEGDFCFDLKDMPDMAPTLSVLAAIRPGRTIIEKVAHLRLKESDRLHALALELNRIGVPAEEKEDGIIIQGGHPHEGEIETYNDHRIAMSFAILGLAVPGIRIKDPGCVQKSFPHFWDTLEGIYV